MLGSDVASVAALAGLNPAEAKTVHERPAVLQELEWTPSRWVAGSNARSVDPVEQILFSFYNDQLFQIVVDYGDERTEGMTSADMVEGISSIYGAPLVVARGVTDRTRSRLELESGPVVARWGDSEHHVALYQLTYSGAYRLIVADNRLEDLARTAETQAQRLDVAEAPAREGARKKKEDDDARAAAAKARAVNKGVFRP